MLNKYFYDISVTVIGIMALIFAISSIGLLMHIPINIFYTLIPLIIGLIYLKKQSSGISEFFVKTLILSVIIIFSYYIAISVWDFSWDGRASHITTAIMLKEGWLPFYTNYQDFAKLHHIYPASAFWGNCYMHLFETIEANVYKITNQIESAKLINSVIMTALFMYSYVVAKEFKPKFKLLPLLISVIVISNPICICQWFTSNVDLFLYSVFSFLILTIMKIELNKSASNTDVFIFASSSLMLATTKFTGGMYLCIILSLYFIHLITQKRALKKYITTTLLTGVLILTVSVSPLYTNYRDFGHPFHPLFGKNKINIFENSYPVGFKNMTYAQRFFISTFAESAISSENPVEKNSNLQITPELKIPFTINIKSLCNYFLSAGMTIGGFGYFWSGILILSLFYLFFIRFRNQNEKNIFWLIFLMIIISTFANPQNWWARYIPQFWLFPLLTILFGFLQNDFSNIKIKKIKRMLLYFILIATIANSTIIHFQNSFFTTLINISLKRQYHYLELAIKENSKIHIMMKPEYKNMIAADETVLIHLKEIYDKTPIIFDPYDESKVTSGEYIPLEYVQIISRKNYFCKITN